MTTAEKLLKLVENADLADTATLAAIDARVWCWINGHDYIGSGVADHENFRYWKRGLDVNAQMPKGSMGKVGLETGRYTRSRDALKAISPQGWARTARNVPNAVLWFQMFKADHLGNRFLTEVPVPHLPTEEMAELHAIIQAIAYERRRADVTPILDGHHRDISVTP